MVAHDLRQPLQSMTLFLDALGILDQRQRPALARLGGCLADMRGLIDSLTDLAGLEAGKVTAALQEVDLFEMMEMLAACYAPMAAAKGLAWAMLPVCRVLRVRTDPALLIRILRNLMENAIRYTEAGIVSLRCVAGADGLLDLQVIDSGPGIPDHQLGHIFEEYHQLPVSGPEPRAGMGLGLAIVLCLSNLLGHKLHVASAPGLGSQFSVAVPLVY